MRVWSPLPSELWSGGGKTETAQPQPRYATNSIIASSFPWLREELPGPSRPAGDPAAATLSRPMCAGGLTWPKTSAYPTAATTLAVSTQGPQEAVDHLDGTDNYLDRPYDQQDGEEGQIPGNHVARLLALAPYVRVPEVISVRDTGEKRDTG